MFWALFSNFSSSAVNLFAHLRNAKIWLLESICPNSIPFGWHCIIGWMTSVSAFKLTGFIKQKVNRLKSKEVYNGGVACSLLHLRSLEKTVIASLFHSGLHSGNIFCGKNEAIHHVSRQQVMRLCHYFYKKRLKNIMVPNWFLIIWNFFWCQIKVFTYWIHVSLGLKLKNLGSEVPS